MAWIREYNAGQTGVGERWSVIAGRPDATSELTWADTHLWTGIVWAKEVKSSELWGKEAKSAESWTKEA